MKTLLLTGFALFLMSAQAAANDYSSADLRGSLDLSASLGVVSGTAHELVYDPTTRDKVSELIWDMEYASVLNFEAKYQMSRRLGFYGSAAIGYDGENYMDDYDWLAGPPPAPYSDHSWHDDTKLDHYYTLDGGVTYAVLDSDQHKFNLLGGFKYTDTQWSAYGGCYWYNSGADQGCFPDDLKGITYRQMIPAVYGGVGYVGSFDQFSFSVDGRLGVTMGAKGDDDHWLRDLNFVDNLRPAPYVGLNAKLSYSYSHAYDIFAAVAYDHFFEMVGPTDITDTITGASATTSGNAGGGALSTLNLSIGASMNF
jgi:outer membrane protease